MTCLIFGRASMAGCSPVAEPAADRGRSRSGGMAYDSGANAASNAASFDRMWPGLRRRIAVG